MYLNTARPVGVLGPHGVCWLAHRAQAFAQDYVQACGVERDSLLPGGLVWLIQPDGQVRAVRLASWAPEHTPELAPGALIWLGWPLAMRQASSATQEQLQALSAQTADWLARLWPSPRGDDLPLWREGIWPDPPPPSPPQTPWPPETTLHPNAEPCQPLSAPVGCRYPGEPRTPPRLPVFVPCSPRRA